MKAMLLDRVGELTPGALPLRAADVPAPDCGPGKVLIEVSVCGVCHTELDEIEGRLTPPRLPIILGHQIVGRITKIGPQVSGRSLGERVGVAWIFSACGKCSYCLSERENLCPEFLATGRDRNGGYAELVAVPASFVYPIPETLSDQAAAPLLCAGAIGYRSLSLTGLKNGERLGLTGFGSSARLVLAMAKARFPKSEVYVFARDESGRKQASALGADWAGDTRATPPKTLDAVIDTTPAWTPIVASLERLAPGGRLVINAIRKEEADKAALAELNYPTHLWLEKEIKSVANVTRKDVREFLALAAEIQLEPTVEDYPLAEANVALLALKFQPVSASKVLLVR